MWSLRALSQTVGVPPSQHFSGKDFPHAPSSSATHWRRVRRCRVNTQNHDNLMHHWQLGHVHRLTCGCVPSVCSRRREAASLAQFVNCL